MGNPLQLVLLMIGVYLLIGICFGVWFVSRGAAQRDATARSASTRVRMIFLPGAVALWPLLLTTGSAAERSSHPSGPQRSSTDLRQRHVMMWLTLGPVLLLGVLSLLLLRPAPLSGPDQIGTQGSPTGSTLP